ncbi:YdcF family protein [Neptuniibacter halophilus]|uniref:YdcF family protein n=1 Tax=Neptuniibacter halophilus TaxID=651666 RepID=UPI0025722FFE|nr:YdcF family protein [Neptuniibacter halophilus]
MTDLFFSLSKLFWIIVQPDHFLLLMLLLGLLLWRRVLGVILVWGSVLLMLLISAFPLGNYLLEPLEQRFPKTDLEQLEAPVAGIIVLGGGEDAERSVLSDQPQFNDAAERLMSAPALWKRYPQATLIFSGGSGSLLRPEYRGADVAKQWLDEQGIESRVLFDRDSRNTWQNALYTKELIREMEPAPEGKWLLVTSAFHMPRSMGLYRQAGIDVLPYPVDYRVSENRFSPNLNSNMADLNTAVREWIGLAAYYLTGKTAEWLPGPVDNREQP